MTVEAFLRFIGEVIAVGGGAAVLAYGLFIWLGRKWLDHYFNRSLADYQQAQKVELDRYRYQINTLFNRITKIHEKEIEVLPIAWQKLQAAHKYLAHLTSPLHDHLEIVQMDKEQVMKFQQELKETEERLVDFHNYLLDNSIFLSSDLYAEFIAADNLFRLALQESMAARHGVERERLTLKVYEDVYEKVEPIKEKIKDLVQKRLHYAEAE